MQNAPTYSHAVVKTGTPVFVSGQVALDGAGNVVGEGNAAAQAVQVMANLETVLRACGGAMADIVKLNVYTTDLAFRPAIAEARAKYFAANDAPASTFVVISSLADPRFLVEIEAVAMIE
jgi:enamine deaminase RidA (YjgF/YER057c/UK114 family)